MKSDYPAGAKLRSLEVFNRVLGLDLTPALAKTHIEAIGSEYDVMLKEYAAARNNKNFTASDELRKKFTAAGLTVEDLPDGTSRLRKK